MHRKKTVLESSFSKAVDLICYDFIEKRLQQNLLNFREHLVFTEHLQWLLLCLSGRPMLCELNWYIETPGQVFSSKFCKIFQNIINHLRWLFLSVTGSKTSKYTMTTSCNGLIVCKYSQWGNKFLPTTAVYLEPSQKNLQNSFFAKIVNG